MVQGETEQVNKGTRCSTSRCSFHLIPLFTCSVSLRFGQYDDIYCDTILIGLRFYCLYYGMYPLHLPGCIRPLLTTYDIYMSVIKKYIYLFI